MNAWSTHEGLGVEGQGSMTLLTTQTSEALDEQPRNSLSFFESTPPDDSLWALIIAPPLSHSQGIVSTEPSSSTQTACI